jgi:Fe2+ transport system protein FeoA
MHCQETARHNEISAPSSFPLAIAAEGEKVKIVRFRSGALLRERLLSMGIQLHDELRVVQRQHGGALLIEKSGSRYALGGGMAHKINVIRC